MDGLYIHDINIFYNKYIITMNIAVVNFWTQNTEDLWVIQAVAHILGKVNIVKPDNNPDILFSSCFGDINNVTNSNARIKILLYGENLNLFPPYNKIDYMSNVFDLIVGSKYTNIKNGILRLPLWIQYHLYFEYKENDNILKKIEESYTKNKVNKTQFASLISTHDSGGQRTILYNELVKYGKILCPSNFKHNTDRIPDGPDAKIKYLANTIFNICLENSKYEGYCTEKIFDALQGGNIPIYWGIVLPETNILNHNKYCFVNVENPKKVKEAILYAVTNKKIFFEGHVFKKNAKYVIDDYYKIFTQQIKYKLNLIPKQKIYGMTFINKDSETKINDIEKIGTDSLLFDSFICHNENIIDSEFKTKYSDYLSDEKTEGHLIWKVYTINNLLNTINDNDVIIYIDSDVSINITDKTKIRFNEYIEMINNNWTGFLRFKLDKKTTNNKILPRKI